MIALWYFSSHICSLDAIISNLCSKNLLKKSIMYFKYIKKIYKLIIISYLFRKTRNITSYNKYVYINLTVSFK